MSNSLQPHGLQHTRLPCPLPTPRTCSNSCPSNWWCHPTISSSVVLFYSCLHCCPASGSFPRRKFFSLESSQSIRVSALVLQMNIQDWFPLGWTGWISLQSMGLSRVFSNTTAFFIVQLSHPYMTTRKTIALTRWIFDGKVISLLFNMLSRLVITFLPRNKHLLISWLQSPSAVILEPPKCKVSHCLHCFPIYLPWSDGTRCHDLSFLNVSFKPTFSLSSFTCMKKLSSSS